MSHGSTFLSAVSGAPWEDAAPLARVLGVELSPESATLSAAHAHALWKELSYLGSNDLAYLLRGFEGVDYPEIVRDVGKHLKLLELQSGEAERVVELNEQRVLAKIFADNWAPLDVDQRRQLLGELNLDESHLALGGAAVAAAVLDGRAGPFAIYKLSRIVANSAARVLPARGLARARRKAVQAVVLVASLRQAQRTALAETALAGAETASEPLAKPVAQQRRRKLAAGEKAAGERAAGEKAPGEKAAGEKAARRPSPPQQRKKKAAKPPRALPKHSRKKATAKRASAKKATAKKATSKKVISKKVTMRRKAGTRKNGKKQSRATKQG